MATNPPESRLQKAIALVKEKHPEAIDPAVQKTLAIDQGHIYESELVYVTYMRPGANPQSPPRSAVYFPAFRDPMHFENSDDFVKWIGARRVQQQTTFWGKAIDASGGIAGLLAVMITGAIIYEYIRVGGTNLTIPAPIATALGTVLGFYFGGKTKDAKEAKSPSPN